jgi:hypothetical protein
VDDDSVVVAAVDVVVGVLSSLTSGLCLRRMKQLSRQPNNLCVVNQCVIPYMQCAHNQSQI